MNLLCKLWSNSPETVFHALKNKVMHSPAQPTWTQVLAGPLKGGQLFVAQDSFTGWGEMVKGRFDSFIYDEVARSCNVAGAVFWDIGAHFGYHSFSFASLVGEGGHVHAFEPNPSNIARFKLHLEKNKIQAKRITLNTFALSDKDGETSFKFSSDVDGSSSSGSHLQNINAPLEADTYSDFKTQLVSTLTIDSFMARADTKVPDIIKIDVEGAELLVLKGGKAFFSKHRPVIFMEVHNILMMYYIHDFLLKHGYSIRVLDEDNSTLSKCFIVAQPA